MGGCRGVDWQCWDGSSLISASARAHTPGRVRRETRERGRRIRHTWPFIITGGSKHGMNMRRLRQIGAHVCAGRAHSAGEQVPVSNTPDECLLTQDQLDQFAELGYLDLPGLFPESELIHLRADVDRMRTQRAVKDPGSHPRGWPYIVSFEHLGKLCSHPAVVERVKQLMRAHGNGSDEIAMHHIHAGRSDEGARGVGWHNDYHCAPTCHDREQLMVHVFHCELSQSRRHARKLLLTETASHEPDL